MTIPPFAPGDAGDGRIRGGVRRHEERGGRDPGCRRRHGTPGPGARGGGEGSLALVLTADEEHASLGLRTSWRPWPGGSAMWTGSS
jgi:hypothetical protein